METLVQKYGPASWLQKSKTTSRITRSFALQSGGVGVIFNSIYLLLKQTQYKKLRPGTRQHDLILLLGVTFQGVLRARAWVSGLPSSCAQAHLGYTRGFLPLFFFFRMNLSHRRVARQRGAATGFSFLFRLLFSLLWLFSFFLSWISWMWDSWDLGHLRSLRFGLFRGACRSEYVSAPFQNGPQAKS